MSVRKRTWTTQSGEGREAWVVDYVDKVDGGVRRQKTFAKKKTADNFAAVASTEVRQGVHTADSASVTIAQAGRLWIATGEQSGLERTTLDGLSPAAAPAYRALPRGREAVAAVSADGARVRGQARARRHAGGR
jgi:hypothetical protein